MLDITRLMNGLTIRCSKKKTNLLNEKCIKACLHRFNSRHYTRLQFLKAVCHSLGAHSDSLQPPEDMSSDSKCDADVGQEDEEAPAEGAATASPRPAVSVHV